MFSAIVTRTLTLATLALASLLAVGCSSTTGPNDDGPRDIVASFEEGTEGWTGSGDFTDLQTSRSRAPYRGYYLFARDRRDGGTWYFGASSEFTGDKSDYYRGTLSYAIRVGFGGGTPASGDYFTGADIKIYSNGERLEYHLPRSSYPGVNAYREYAIRLEAGPGWKLGGAAASAEDVKRILSDVDSIYIRGEYFVGDDWARIDEVTMSAY